MAIDEQSWRPESPFTELEEAERLLMPELELGLDEQEIARPMVTSRLQLGASAPAARVYAKVTARTQGVIAGDSTARGHEHWIAGTGFDYEVVSPRDVATGQPSGKRQHRPVTLTAQWSAASPLLFQALVTNEVLTSVVFEFPAARADGAEVIAERITLTNASISDFRHGLDPTAGNRVDRISFTFQKITIEDLLTARVAGDNWSAPVAEVGEGAFEAETYEVDGAGVRRSDSEAFA